MGGQLPAKRIFSLLALLSFALSGPTALAATDPAPAFLPKALQASPNSYAQYGEAEFDMPGNKTAVLEGQYWHGRLGMGTIPKKATKEEIWAAMKPALMQKGWTVSQEIDHQPFYGVMHYQKDGKDAWLEIAIYYYGSASFDLVETGSAPRTVKLKVPAAKPEKVSAKTGDFPYLAPIKGAKRKNSARDNHPMTVRLPGSKEDQTVGTASIVKNYKAPQGFSTLEFVKAYVPALQAAGWTIIHQSQGLHQTDAVITAHYTKSGRNIWAYLHATPDEFSIQVADAGADDLAKKLAKQCHVALYGVFFDFNKATLKPQSDPVLEKVADVLTKNAALKVEVQGHTDSVGSDAYNLTLSEARAKSVVAWLAAHGVAADRLTAKGYGETRPVASNSTDEGRAKNRRVEIANPACTGK